MGDAIHSSLCANGLSSAVAGWLTDLALRVRRLEKVQKKRIKVESYGPKRIGGGNV